MADQPPVISPPAKPVKPVIGWVCLLLNLFVLPGLGSLFIRHPVKAAIQLVLALAGFALTVVGGSPVLHTIIQTNELPDHFENSFWLAIAGVVLFFIAWVWALASSYSALKDSRKSGL
jgi:hypothetical protein